jgi:hypothetical protein
MYRKYVPECGYQNRREYRTAFEEWLATIDANLFVTLSFAQNARLANARQSFRQWFACLDNYYLGRGWARRNSDERTFAIATAENISTNLHYHCLMRLPGAKRNESIADCAATLDRLWHRSVPRGTCDVEPIYDLTGAARYVAKQFVRPGHHEHYLLASEFHSEATKPMDRPPRHTG